MKRCILYVTGAYPKQYMGFYTKLCNNRYKVAVDGGYTFFQNAGITPDLLIGDFDSLKRIPTSFPSRTKVLQYPTDKDKTDLHLALEYCMKHGAEDIDIVNPAVGDIDHFLGIVFLLNSLLKKRGNNVHKLRMISHAYDARFIHNSKTIFQNHKSDILSILPLSSSIRIHCTGTAYKAKDLEIKYGDSHTLRNRITSKHAVVQIEGAAIVVCLNKQDKLRSGSESAARI